MLEALGIIGATMLAICGVPQAIKSWRDGHSSGVSSGMLALWGGGTFLMAIYVTRYGDVPLLANYAINTAVVCTIARFKFWPHGMQKPRAEARGYRGDG